MSQFVIDEGNEPGGPAAEAGSARAIASFEQGLTLLGAPSDVAGTAELARAATELGNAYLWRQRGPEATAAFARALALAPASFDYGQTWQLLSGLPADAERPSGFGALLELAREQREATGALGGSESGVLLWWLGWARFNDGRWTASEEAFQQGLALAPEYTNAWFYIGLARHYGKDSAGAMEAMHRGWEADPTSMVTTVANAGGAQRAFESLLAWNAAQEPPHNLDAAFLAEMLAQAQPDQVRHWNNLGLFLRDEGERLELEAYKNKTPAPDAALLAELYGRSFEAYRRALELTPEDPQVINDTALMLHYHLDGDVAEVEATYRRALALLEARLAESDLPAEDRARFEQTKSDIGVNLKALLEPAPAEGEAAAGAAEAGAEPKTSDSQGDGS
jgi:tetratricopeptide (TPR) repeat protein